jgi:hypothetical protein
VTEKGCEEGKPLAEVNILHEKGKEGMGAER